ncbi:MAG: hypothetical protein PVG60_07580 [Desulfarculaceae bacterium]
MTPVFSPPGSDPFGRRPVVKPQQPGAGPLLAATALLGIILVVLSTTAFAWWALGPFRLQPLVILAVAAGFRLPLFSGGLVVFSLGYLSDLLSGGIVGLQVTALVAVYVICALAERKLEVNTWPLQMLAVGVMTPLFLVLVLLGLWLVYKQSPMRPDTSAVILAQAVANAVCAPLFFAALRAIVRLLDRFWPQKRSREA